MIRTFHKVDYSIIENTAHLSVFMLELQSASE